MKLEAGILVAVSVTKQWHRGAERFLRMHRASDPASESWLVLAHVLDASDPLGLWIKFQEDDHAPVYSMLIPWQHVLTIAHTEVFSEEVKEEARKFGFSA